VLVPLPRHKRDMEDNVLPLINIVFLLLIFFMVAGVIRPKEPFPLEPPSTTHAESAERENIFLAVAADGRLALAGKTLSTEEVVAWLQENHDEARPLWIKADGELAAADFTALLPDLRRAGVAEVRLLTTPNP